MPTVQHAIDVAATRDECWRVFGDLARWPEWFPLLRRVRGGRLAVGEKLVLDFAAGPATLPVEVTIEECEPGGRIRWVGGRLGVRGDHCYTFAMNSPGLTRVTSSETFSGPGARLIAGPVFAFLDGEVHQSMERFKALVEAAKA